jgi:DNA-binding response OmpR family regulator
MNSLNIAIFGNKIFYEIINEVKLFADFKFEYFENKDLNIDKIINNNYLLIFFSKNVDETLIKKNKIENFPIIFISNDKINKNKIKHELSDHLRTPFSLLEFKKKITALFAKCEFKKNSSIELNDYIINKNERIIIKNNKKLQLSEKEINFLVLFSKNKDPISKSVVLKKVWNYSLESETHTVETHIHRLRKKILEKFKDGNFIKNNNKGYYI